MKRIAIVSLLLVFGFQLLAQSRLTTRNGHAKIFSTTVAEDITANNYSVTSTIDPQTGEMIFSVPVQSFEFDKALMQKHFNQERFMDSGTYPRITFKGKITNLTDVKWEQDGKYNVTVTGDLTIRDVTKNITEKGSIDIQNGKILATSVFVVKDITSYNVGKPSGRKSNNVADNIEVTFTGTYESE